MLQHSFADITYTSNTCFEFAFIAKETLPSPASPSLRLSPLHHSLSLTPFPHTIRTLEGFLETTLKARSETVYLLFLLHLRTVL